MPFKKGAAISGRNPDFLNVNGKKAVIELFGRYWHTPKDKQQRIRHYKKFGFACLVLWEKELQNPTKLTEKVSDFFY